MEVLIGTHLAYGSVFLHPATGHVRVLATTRDHADRHYASTGPDAPPVRLREEGRSPAVTIAWTERGYIRRPGLDLRHLVATVCLVADHVADNRMDDATAVLWASDGRHGGWSAYPDDVRRALVLGAVDLWTDRDDIGRREAVATIWRAVYPLIATG